MRDLQPRRDPIPSWARSYSPLGDLPFLRSMTELEQAAFANEFPSPGLAAFIAASTDEALQERERAEAQKPTNNGRTPPWYAPDGHTATSNFAVRDSARSAQPSGRLAPTHAAAGPLRAVENDAEMAERARACQFYSRGEIPSWLREWSPRGRRDFHSQHGATRPILLRQDKFSSEPFSVHGNQHERSFTGTGTS